jgi:hypothetical protein
MVPCETCGKDVLEGNACCTSCATVITPPPVYTGTRAPEGQVEKPDGFVSWSRKIPLITNPYLVLQCIFIPFGIAIVIGSFLSIITGGEWALLTLFLIIAAGLSMLMLLIMLVLQLVTGGGLDTAFFISNEGVAHKAGSTTRALNRASTGGSAVLGSLSGTGSGLLAMSQENTILRWENIRYISLYRSIHSMVFRSKFMISPVVLYCSEENFPSILAMVKKYALPVATGNL